MINNWVVEWDKRIAIWIDQGSKYDLGLSHIKEAYNDKGNDKMSLQFHAMPEPYVGDPLSDAPLDAVLLTLNPGGSGYEQWRGGEWEPNEKKYIEKDGELVEKVKNASYYDIAKGKGGFPIKTRDWWDGRSRWPARLLD